MYMSLRRMVCFAVCLGLVFSMSACGKKEPVPGLAKKEEAEPVEKKTSDAVEREKREKIVEEKRVDLNNTE